MTATIEPAPEQTATDLNAGEVVGRNFAGLEASGEIGQFLIPYYQAALAIEPKLSEVIIRQMESKESELAGMSGYALTSCETESGSPEVVIHANSSWSFYERMIEERPTTMAIVAENLGLQPEDISPKVIAAFVFSHELGHTNDWIVNGYDETTLNNRHNKDMSTLPVPNFSPGDLIQLVEANRTGCEEWFTRVESHFSSKGITTVEEVLHAQETAYRALETEVVADQFAVKVLEAVAAQD